MGDKTGFHRLSHICYYLFVLLYDVNFIVMLIDLVVRGKPKLKDLCNSVVPKYAAQWKHLGILLGRPPEELDIIEQDNPRSAEKCCIAMMVRWLDFDSDATWEKVEKVTKSLSKDPKIKVAMRIIQWHYKKAVIDQPKLSHKPALPGKSGSKSSQDMQFFELAFLVLHNSSDCTEEDVSSVANAFYCGNISVSESDHLILPQLQQSSSNYYQKCKKYTNIMEIINQPHSDRPFMLLLEGATGMGKTTVCREIAYKWSLGEEINCYKLVFSVSLHDANVKNINSLDALFNQVCPENQELFPGIKNFLVESKQGRNVLVIIDGFDLLFDEHDAVVNEFLKRIIYRDVYNLGSCDLIISSRQPESSKLYGCLNCTRVQLLGFTGNFKHRYIEQSRNQELKEYLSRNTNLNSICYHPFFLATLVCLFQDLKLPSGQTAVIDRIVCCMIAKCVGVHYYASIIELYKELPLKHEVRGILVDISKLAYDVYQSGIAVFKVEDFKCSFKVFKLGFLTLFKLPNQTLLTFIHYSVQEFLIAFHLSTCSKNKQEKFRVANMWKSKYLNVWFHYCNLVNGDDNIIKISLSDSWFNKLLGWKNMSEILEDKIKCLYLVYCFMHSPGDSLYRQVQPKVITGENVLDLSNCTLKDEECKIMHLYLSSCFTKEWKCLNFSNCCLKNEQLVTILNLLRDSLSCGKFAVDVLDIADNNIDINKSTLSAIMSTHNMHQCILSHNKIKDEEITDAILLSEDQFCNFDDNSPRSFLNHNTLFLFYTFPHKYNNAFYSSTIVRLYLIRCEFDSQAMEYICEALKSTLSISLLFVYDNKLDKCKVLQMVEVIKLLNNLHVFLLYELSLSNNDAEDLYQTLIKIHSISRLMIVGANKMLSIKATEHQIIIGFMYIRFVTHLQLRECHITHKIMNEMTKLLNNSTTPLSVLDLSGSRVDNLNLGDFCNTLNHEVRIESVRIQSEISPYSIAELICCGSCSSIDILDSLADVNKQSFGMIAAENIFASQRQSRVMLKCDDEKVGIFHKLDYSSTIVETTLQLTQLFINNCTIDGRVLASSLDNSEFVVLLHLSNIKWDGEVFYTSNIFINNMKIIISVCENHLQKIVIQNLLNAFDSSIKISRMISTDDVFIAHSCSFGLVRWHITQELSCDPLELFYMCNCTMVTDLECRLIENYVNHRKCISEVILHGNDISTRQLYKLLSNTKTEIIDQLFICENVLNCSSIVDLLSAVPHVTLLSSNMFISDRGISKQIIKAVNIFPKELSVLRMFSCEYTVENFDALVLAIEACTNLKEFTVRGGNLIRLHASACSKLLCALLSATSLTHFSFNDNKITNEVVDVLKTIIDNNSELGEIRLNSLGLNSTNVANICHSLGKISNLKVLSLTDNLLSKRAACDLAAVIVTNTNLEKLYMDNNYLGTEGIAKMADALMKISKLKVIRFKNNGLQGIKLADKLYKVISKNPSLENICFDCNQLHTTGIKEITQGFGCKSQLKILGMNNCGMTKEAATQVANVITKSTKLEKLQLCDNLLMAEGCNVVVRALKGLNRLTKLYISNNNITEQAADGIAEMIIENSSLQVLDVGSNLLLTTGIIKVASALSKVHEMKELWINNNYITEKAADGIATVITSNRKLEKLQLNDNSLKTAGVHIICKALQQNSCLKVLFIGNNDLSCDSADDIVSVIESNSNIKVLELGNNKLGTTGAIRIASALCGIRFLTVLGLENNLITSGAADHIAAAITSNNRLEKLWLQNNRLESKDIEVICKALECTKYLKLFEINSKITKLPFDVMTVVIFKNFSTIQTLCITNFVISMSVLNTFKKNLKPLCQLKRLRIDDNDFDDGAVDTIEVVIANTTELQSLSLHSNGLWDNSITKITNTINHITTLRVLHLSNNNMTESSASDVAVLISNNLWLERVYLGNNRLKAAGIKKLVYSFKNLFYLKELGLNGNHLDEDAAAEIACIITDKTHLEKLWINNNRFRASGINKVCVGLKNITGLKSLKFENNKITKDAAEAIANVIKNNAMLEDLLLGYNLLQTQGIIKLAKALKEIHCLKRLSLNDNHITDEAADDIAEVITTNVSLENICLNNNYFKDVGFNVIFKALLKIQSLKVLQLEKNNISLEGIDIISVVISKNPLLESINLGNTNLGSKSFIKLSQALKQLHCLKVLGLNDNRIKEDAAKHIAEVINNNSGLEKLYLNNNKLEGIGMMQLCEQIKQHSSFKHFSFDSNSITDEAVVGLSSLISNNRFFEVFSFDTDKFTAVGTVRVINSMKHLHNLTKLAISSVNITEKATNAIAEIIVNNKGLKMLWLCNNNLKDENTCIVARALKELKELRSLRLVDNNISEVAADSIREILANNPLLEQFDLGSNKLGSRGVVKLAGSLKMLYHLKILELNDNEIDGVEEDAAKHIAAVINSNAGLEVLDLDNNRLKGAGMKQLCHSVRQHSSFKHLLFGNNCITDEATDDLASLIINNCSLEVLNIEKNYFTSEGINILTNSMRKLHNLTRLFNNFNHITKEAGDSLAEVISSNREMETLWLCDNDLGDEGICKVASALKGLQSIKHLRFACNNITKEAADDIAEAITKNPLLEHVDLGYNRLGSSGVIKIAAGLKMLHHLKILKLDNNEIEENSANHIAEVINNNVGLEKLYLFSNNLEGVGVKVLCEGIKKHSNLKVLSLDNNNVTEEAADALESVISNNKSLEIFGFASNNLITTKFNKLSNGMTQLCTLKILNISDNKITEDVAVGISKVIMSNKGLERLWLSNNAIRDKGMHEIACGLKEVKFIKGLRLANNNISDKAADKVVEAITSNPLLEHVDLGGNRLGCGGVVKLAGGLKMLHQLETLDLDDNGIEEGAAKHIAEVINSNTRMRLLSLNNNKLKEVGVKELCGAILQHSSFKAILFKNNLISEGAADAIALVVKSNTLLVILCLGGNELKTTGVNIIITALKGLRSLKTLDISNNQIDDDAADSIAAMIMAIASLRSLALHDNHLTSKTATKIGNAINHHASLRDLSLESEYISDIDKHKIKQVIEGNTQFICFGKIFMRPKRQIKELKQFRDVIGTLNLSKMLMGNVLSRHTESSGRISHINETSQLLDAVIKNPSAVLLVKVPSQMMKEQGECSDFVVIYWSTANQLDVLLQDNDLCKDVSTLVVRCHPDTQIDDLDVTVITHLFSKFDNLENLDIGKFSAIPISLTRSKLHDCSIPKGIIFKSMVYQKSLNLTPLQLLHPVSLLSSIRLLNLSGNKVTQEVAEILLSRCANLKTLLMEDCELQTETLIIIASSLFTATKLCVLDLSLNNISPSLAINHLNKANSSLQNIYLDGNFVASSKEVKLCNNLAALTDLSIDSTMLPDIIHLYEIGLIGGIKLNLKRLIVCDHSCKEKAIVVLSNPSRKSKKIILCQGFKLAKHHAMVMPHRLYSLKLVVFIEVNEETVILKWDSLKNIDIILCLRIIGYCEELVCYDLTDDRMTEGDVKIILTLIRGNANLKTISFNGCSNSPREFYDRSVKYMHRHLKSSMKKFIRQVIPCNASTAALKEILFTLQHSVLCLKVLNLSCNYISEETAKIVAIALKKCTALETLLLKNCKLNSESLNYIVCSLGMVSSLKIIDISWNNFDKHSFDIVGAIINTNQDLRELYLDNNCFHLHNIPDDFWSVFTTTHLSSVAIDMGLISESMLHQLAFITIGGSGIKHLLLVHPTFTGVGLINLLKCSETTSVHIKLHSHGFTIKGKYSETVTVDWKCTEKLTSFELLKFLGTFEKVTTLDLHIDNNCSEPEMSAIAIFLKNYTNLKEVALSQMASHTLLKCLQSLNVKKSLHEFRICQCNINVNVAATLTRILEENKKLHSIVLHNCYLSTPQISVIMSSLQGRHLVTLDLTSNYIADEAVNNISGAILSSATTLENFSIGSNKLQTSGMINLLTFLTSVNSLTHLSPACNEIADNISHYISCVICKNPKLIHLCLRNVCLQTIGAIEVTRALKSLSHLQFLDLSSNSIEEEASADLAAVVNCNINLKQFFIGENYLGSNGLIAITNALSALKGLQKLDITSNSATVETAHGIANIIRSNLFLNSLLIGSECRQISTEHLERNYIHEFILQKKWHSKIADHYGQGHNIIICNVNKFMIKLLNSRSVNYNTKSLMTKCNKLQSKGIVKICKALKCHNSLVRFSIENNDIDDEAADDIAAVITCNTEIQQLWIGSNRFSDSGILKIIKQLQAISTLKVFDLSHTIISAELAHDIAKALAKSTALEQLWLENNEIPPGGLVAIMFSLLNSEFHIISISLRGNNVINEHVVLAAVCTVVDIHETMEHIYLGNIALNDTGMSKIKLALTNTIHDHLHTLDLCNTNITEVDSVLEVITGSSQLQELFLGDNKLCSTGAIKIVTALQGSHTIQVLGLSHNHITCEAAGEISTALSSMPYLSTVMLDGNELEVDGVCTIIEGVQKLNWLMILSVTDNINSEEEKDSVRMKFGGKTKFNLYL